MKKNRRNFLKYSALGLAGLTAAGCSSFDDYLFEDNFNFDEEVLIVGGGLAGLALAYKLRNTQNEFRLFEAAPRFGGRLLSGSGADFGPAVFSAKDKNFNLLIDELKIQKLSYDKENYYLADGMEQVIVQLKERILGLLPYRNFRLRWRLVEIGKVRGGFELVFEHPGGVKRFNCRKLALSIPPSQWSSVRGLLTLQEMSWASEWLESLKSENSLKFILPPNALPSGSKSLFSSDIEGLSIRQFIKKNKTSSHAEIEVSYPVGEAVSIDFIYGVLKKKLQISFPFQNLGPEQFYDWQQVKFVQAAYFRNAKAIPASLNPNFQILGDFSSEVSPNTMEGALLSAQKAANRFV